jgi:PBSX family phage terminase large subunit
LEQVVLENNYKPTEKAQAFHGSDCFFQVLVGGMGSGKSRMVIHEIEQSATQWPGMPIAVYRKTLPSLRDSTLAEWRNHCTHEIWEFRERDVQARCANGSFVNFRGLDEASKAKSTEYALLILEEADELTFEDFMFLKGRVRKKGPWPLRVILIINPVDEDHWIYKEFVKNADAYRSAGGLLVLHLSTFDNIENLPAGYIEQNTAGMTADEIDRYVHGHWGTIVKGESVYAKHLNPDLHIEHWEYIRGIHRLVRGWDFGFNHPACSFRLVDPSGRANCHYSVMGEKIDLDVFADQVLEYTARSYPGLEQIKDFGDPRGHDRTQTSQSGKANTAFEVLQEKGIYAVGERGTRAYVEPGIKAVRNEFTKLVGGKPKLTIDPRNSLLRAAYFGKYVRDETGAPKKDGFYEHVADADRMISHHTKFDSAVASATRVNQAKRSVQSRSITGYRRMSG